MTLTLPDMLTLLFHLQISRFPLFTFTAGLLMGNDESKMEFKKGVTIPTLPFEPLFVALIKHQSSS